MRNDSQHVPIAVVGLGCWYPGAQDIKQLWENILARRQQFRRMPDNRLPLEDYYDSDATSPDKTYGQYAAVIDGFEFDWISRHVPKSTYESTDIVHWLALEVALKALADSGYTPDAVPAERAGVILGNTLTGEQTRASTMRQRWPFVRKTLRAAAAARGLNHLIGDLEQTMEAYFKSVFAPTTEDSLAGGLSNTIAGRICNVLNWNGGGYTVDGACSSSLLAVATAANALANGDMDFALAGGVDISLDTFELIGFAKTGALTRDHMSVYDQRANGFIPGEGCGFVALKRLEDAQAAGDEVYAVLHGWGISTDGKGGLTAPNRNGQSMALRRAYERAGYSPQTVTFFEGHGTGTTVGDRTELEGIMLALGEAEREHHIRPHAITSFKSIVGHTKAAAGIGGFIKAVIAVNRRVVPPTAGCKTPNAVFETSGSTLYPALYGENYPADEKIRAGVSAMGFGGINCHVTLESGDFPSARLQPALDERRLMASKQDTELFIFSASTFAELSSRVDEALALVSGISIAEMADFAAYLAGQDKAEAVRAVVIANHPDDLLEQLAQLQTLLRETPPASGEVFTNPQRTIWISQMVEPQRLGFLFPGQGAQQLNMARVLVERFEWARALVAQADTWLAELGLPGVSRVIYQPLDRVHNAEQLQAWKRALDQTEIAQPAICLASILWLEYLRRLGVSPDAVVGHSLGELTAFYAAGAFDARTLIQLAGLRGQAMAAHAEQAGAMLSLACDAETAAQLMTPSNGYAVIANLNSPRQTVISGERAALKAIADRAQAQAIQARFLPVSNAFHSAFVAAASENLRQHPAIPQSLNPLTCALFSGMEGKPVAQATRLREHVADQITSQVDFVRLVAALSSAADVLIEVGPGRILSGLVGDIISEDRCLPIASRPDADRDLNAVLAQLFAAGHRLDWAQIYTTRLIRPFVPLSQRKLIENPCERPLPETVPTTTGLTAALAAATDLPADTLQSYLAQRGGFIADVIRADMQHLPGLNQVPVSPDPVPSKVERIVTGHATSVEARLIDLIARRTGYPVETLLPSMRMLDDLNLDSIKSAELISALTVEYNIGGKLEPSMLANATIQTIADTVRAFISQEGGDGVNARDLLVNLIAQRTGFPANSLLPHLRLLDDLNLDSIKSGELIAETARQMGLAGKIEPVQFANASIEAIASALEQLRGASAETLTEPHTTTWVRSFVTEYIPQPLTLGKPQAWDGKSVVVLHQSEDTELAEALNHLLLAKGANSHIALFEQAAQQRAACVIALFPRAGASSWNVERVVDALSAVAHLEDMREVAFIQSDNFYRATAFARSLHLEHPALKVRVIDAAPELTADTLVTALETELSTDEACTVVAYDAAQTRRIPVQRLHDHSIDQVRNISWLEDDVILVTGGAKGITAECAFALAGVTGARFALVGSSPYPQDAQSEIARTLTRFRAAGFTCEYFPCDIADIAAVEALVHHIEQTLGSITGIVHGAAINKPRRAEQTDRESAYAEIAPKVLGALNLAHALKDAPLKLFAGLSSIIGVTGMPGNAWYGFSNELLDLILERFSADHPATAVISMAFSVWGEVGMGARMGSVHALARMGIESIPTEQGVERFIRLMTHNPGAHQVIVAARLGGLDTWQPALPPQRPTADRFLEQVIHFEPGVELTVRAHLTLQRDTYVTDHVFNGSYLFPTVFGLEAMAQAVAYVTATPAFEHLRIEDIRLERPITVDSELGTEIEIRALVLERMDASDTRRVQVEIGTQGSGFTRAHFAATFVLAIPDEPRVESQAFPPVPLALNPKTDLYSGLLFQGEQFQRMTHVFSLDDHTCLFAAEARPESFLLGDPYFRDTLLQAPQLTVSQDISLPVYIESIELHDFKVAMPTAVKGIAVFDGPDGRQLRAHTLAINEQGQVVQAINGYRLQIIAHHDEYPTPDEIANPTRRDLNLISGLVKTAGEHFRVVPPVVGLEYLPELHSLPRDQRHQRELPLLEHTVRQALDTHAPVIITWQDAVRPVIDGHHLHLSVSHDDDVCLCAVSRWAQGCDIAPITGRDGLAAWTALLGEVRQPLLNQLVGQGEALDHAGTRIWAAVEAIRKATQNTQHIPLSFVAQTDGFVLFESSALATSLRVLTFPVKLLRGGERIIALIVETKPTPEVPSPTSGTELALSYQPEHYGIRVTHDGPQGQLVFSLRFPLSFKEVSTPGRSLYFSHFFHWMGKLREAACQPVFDRLADQFATGQWGMVTNRTETHIWGTASAKDTIEGSIWLEKTYGAANSTMDLCYAWHKLNGDGTREQIAASRMTATWVAIRGHGVVEPQPFPPYFAGYIQQIAPAVEGDHQAISTVLLLGDEQFAVPLNPLNRVALFEQTFDTSLEDANLVGNIYFANYGVWQGRTLDHFLYKLAPESMGQLGQWVCTHSKVEHLREAMPFDRIAVKLYLKAIHTRGVVFQFDYFRVTERGYEKLAYGEHHALWQSKAADNRYETASIPAALVNKLQSTLMPA